MLDFINFLRGLTFFMITGNKAVSFKNETVEFASGGSTKTWDNLITSLWLGGGWPSSVKLVTRKSQDQLDADHLKAEAWIERSADVVDPQSLEDCLVEADRLRKEEVVEWIDLHDLFRDAAVELGILQLDEEGCFDPNIRITENDWNLVISRVIAKLQ